MHESQSLQERKVKSFRKWAGGLATRGKSPLTRFSVSSLIALRLRLTEADVFYKCAIMFLGCDSLCLPL